jgi:hypothetical protein
MKAYSLPWDLKLPDEQGHIHFPSGGSVDGHLFSLSFDLVFSSDNSEADMKKTMMFCFLVVSSSGDY